MKTPESLQEAVVYFSDPERAFVYAVNLRWPDGVIACPRCGNDKHSFIKTRLIWFCKGCKKQFTVKVGTIFEDSALGLDKWMTAVWMLVNCKNGISSHELGRALHITQKSAWFMLQRIRLALKKQNFGKIGGPGREIESDETFIGGSMRNMHKRRRKQIYGERRGCVGKTAVMGLFDRDSRTIRTKVLPNVKRETLQSEILEEVKPGTSVYTDESMAYHGLAEKEYVHEVVNHLHEYVNGRVHTNCLENFWSLLKRGLNGTYVAVEPFHLSRYVDEQAFRFNTRKDKNGDKISDAVRFAEAMSQVAGKRLTYSELTGKSDSPHMPETGTGTETDVPF
jgi:transposase-like protein